jgi:hypothetical protein|tara:strand:+ start:14634 stop:14930 length:297 start_codon:yes stop_codon:yes gene_type:complete
MITLEEHLRLHNGEPIVEVKKYFVASRQTHFEYFTESNEAWCTHGSWGGKLKDLGIVRNFDKMIDETHYSVVGVEVGTIEWTDAGSYYTAEKEGLIDL